MQRCTTAIATTATVLVVIGTAAAIWLGSSPGTKSPTPPKPISSIAQNLRACLLSDGDPATHTVWDAIQKQATAQGGINVQQLTQPSDSTGDDSYINSLIQQHCQLIVTVGTTAAQAAQSVAPDNLSTYFAVVGAHVSATSNLTYLDDSKVQGSTVATLFAQARSLHR